MLMQTNVWNLMAKNTVSKGILIIIYYYIYVYILRTIEIVLGLLLTLSLQRVIVTSPPFSSNSTRGWEGESILEVWHRISVW